MRPQVQVPRPDVGVDVSRLLLADSPRFLDIVKHLLDRRPVRHLSQNHGRRRVDVGGEVCHPLAVFPFHQRHPDHAPRRPPRGQECFECFLLNPSVDLDFFRGPASRRRRSLRQADPMVAVNRLASPFVLRSSRVIGKGPQRRIATG